MKLNIVNIGLVIGGVYVAYKLFSNDGAETKTPATPKQDLPQPAPDGEFSNFLGGLFKKKKKSSTARAVQTRCETNLERLGRLFPNEGTYNAELGKAFQQQGSNFNSWAQSTAKPCFVVGAEQGGLQGGSISFNGDFC